MIGFQSILFAVFTKTFAITEGLLPPDPRMNSLWKIVNLERGLLISIGMLLIGLAMIGVAANEWRVQHFGSQDYAHSLRWVIPGSTLAAMGF